MSGPQFIVTGTGTGIGKTIFATALTGALNGVYWKPVQAGLEGESDSEIVSRLSGQPVLPEAYRLQLAASPHRAAAEENIHIDAATLELPQTPRPLVVEGAGGLMVPLNDQTLFIDLFARWRAPLILVAATALGTINHSLLSLEAIRRRDLPLLGIAFVGAAQPESESIICRLGGVRRLGRLPPVSPMTRTALAEAFARNFDLADFT